MHVLVAARAYACMSASMLRLGTRTQIIGVSVNRRWFVHFFFSSLWLTLTSLAACARGHKGAVKKKLHQHWASGCCCWCNIFFTAPFFDLLMLKVAAPACSTSLLIFSLGCHWSCQDSRPLWCFRSDRKKKASKSGGSDQGCPATRSDSTGTVGVAPPTQNLRIFSGGRSDSCVRRQGVRHLLNPRWIRRLTLVVDDKRELCMMMRSTSSSRTLVHDQIYHQVSWGWFGSPLNCRTRRNCEARALLLKCPRLGGEDLEQDRRGDRKPSFLTRRRTLQEITRACYIAARRWRRRRRGKLWSAPIPVVQLGYLDLSADAGSGIFDSYFCVKVNEETQARMIYNATTAFKGRKPSARTVSLSLIMRSSVRSSRLYILVAGIAAVIGLLYLYLAGSARQVPVVRKSKQLQGGRHAVHLIKVAPKVEIPDTSQKMRGEDAEEHLANRANHDRLGEAQLEPSRTTKSPIRLRPKREARQVKEPSGHSDSSSRSGHSKKSDRSEHADRIHLVFVLKKTSASLLEKFSRVFHSILGTSTTALTLHVLADGGGKLAIDRQTASARSAHRVIVEYYDINKVTADLEKVIAGMQKVFSSGKHNYFNDPLFFVGPFLYRILPENVHRVIKLDVDLEFRGDISQLASVFDSFKPTQVFALAREAQPVYWHVLYDYRNANPQSRVGAPPPNGLTGFNSGVMLQDLHRIRTTTAYRRLINSTAVVETAKKYKFSGHLGDQDFFTLLSFDHRELFYTLPCVWNRQLCRFWEHAYKDIFMQYFRCDGKIMVYHGNCNSVIPLK